MDIILMSCITLPERIQTIKDAGAEVTTFTTHSRGILSHYGHDTIVFDKDHLKSIKVQYTAE